MRVLMFGWEFPPSISGGLGVACEGLVRGLLELDTDVSLVLPRRAVATPIENLRIIPASEASGRPSDVAAAAGPPCACGGSRPRSVPT
jgi:hypothetical protein